MKFQNFIRSCAVTVAVTTAVVFAAGSHAAFVSGQMGYSTEPVVASGWSFDAGDDLINTDDGQVDIATGDLAGLVGLSMVQPTEIDYSVGAVDQVIWTAGDFYFLLKSVNVLYEMGNFLALEGEGQIFSTSGSFSPTDASWQFTGNFLTYSAATVAEPPAVVPVPVTAWLFGSALLAFPILGRARR